MFPPPARLLLAIADDAARARILDLLDPSEFTWDQVATSQDVLDRAADKLDLICLEHSPPSLDAAEVARQLRANPATAGIALLLISASAAPPGCDGCLEPPASPQALLTLLRALARARRAEDQVSAAARHCKEVEGQLRKRVKELADADRRKDDFLAQLAHELRGPLAPLLNALHLMKLRAADPPTVAEARDLAERQVRQLARLVDDLLEVSRIARGKLHLRKERVEVQRLVANAVETARPLIEARQHRLTVLLPPEPVFLDADPARLVQVLVNLLNNAAKYTEPGGQIWITCEQGQDEVQISVRDTGVGLSADLLPHVFDLFVQGKPGSYDGLGIGLSLVRGVVELHGGSVVALSDGPGEGTDFVLRLPSLVENLASPPPPEHPTAEPIARPRRILVVDDDIDAARSLGQLLQLWGHVARTAHDGLTALETARQFRPDVVILDLSLPGGMDGYEVARRIKTEEKLDNALLVALTGWGQEEDRRHTRETGFEYHLVKPVDPAELQQLLVRTEEQPAQQGVAK